MNFEADHRAAGSRQTTYVVFAACKDSRAAFEGSARRLNADAASAIFKHFNGGAAKDFCARVFGCLEEGFIEKKSRNADCFEGQRRARLF